MAHLSDEVLIQYIEHQLSDAERADAEAHLACPCQRCNQTLRRMRQVLENTASNQTTAPPAEVLQRAIASFQQLPVLREPRLRFLAKLLFDSQLQFSLSAVRGGTQKRQMLFSTRQVDIDLQITPKQDTHYLIGQILSTEETEEERPAAFVRLKNDTGEFLRGTEADTLGQFSFQQVPPGTYDLVFDFDDQEIAITDLELTND
jgi:hypothetical protein